MKKIVSALLSVMMLSMTGMACLPAQAAEETAETTTTTAPASDAWQMTLNFDSTSQELGTPLYLEGITASVFSQKEGYLVCAQSITDETLFKVDTFEFDRADRPGTYNVYVTYIGDESMDLYAIYQVTLYEETEAGTTTTSQTFGPVGTVWTETTVPQDTTPFDTTFTTTSGPIEDTAIETTFTTTSGPVEDETDYPDDTTYIPATTRTTAAFTGTTTAVTTYYRTTLPTTETTQSFDPVGTVVTTGTTPEPQETTVAYTTNVYTNEEGVVCFEYYANVGDTIMVDETYTDLHYIIYDENATYDNGIITAVNPGEFYIIFCTSETFGEQVARVDVTILPNGDETTTTSEQEWTETTMMSTWNTTLSTTGMTTAMPAPDTTAVPESTLDEDGNVIYSTTATSLTVSTSEEEPIATTTTGIYDGEGTTVATTVTTAPTTTADTEIAPETSETTETIVSEEAPTETTEPAETLPQTGNPAWFGWMLTGALLLLTGGGWMMAQSGIFRKNEK